MNGLVFRLRRIGGCGRNIRPGLLQGPAELGRQYPLPVLVAARELLHVVMARSPQNPASECRQKPAQPAEILMVRHGVPLGMQTPCWLRLCRATASEKKPTWSNTSRCSTTSAY